MELDETSRAPGHPTDRQQKYPSAARALFRPSSAQSLQCSWTSPRIQCNAGWRITPFLPCFNCSIPLCRPNSKFRGFSPKMVTGGRLREVFSKNGKVGLGIHMSVFAISIVGLYVAIQNKVDIESRISLPSHSKEVLDEDSWATNEETQSEKPTKGKLECSELLTSSGGALALTILCNKVLFPVQVPITIVLTPPIARFLARRTLIKDNIRESFGFFIRLMKSVSFLGPFRDKSVQELRHHGSECELCRIVDTVGLISYVRKPWKDSWVPNGVKQHCKDLTLSMENQKIYICFH